MQKGDPPGRLFCIPTVTLSSCFISGCFAFQKFCNYHFCIPVVSYSSSLFFQPLCNPTVLFSSSFVIRLFRIPNIMNSCHVNTEGAAFCSTGHSEAHCCTLSAGKSRLRVQHTTVQVTQWQITAPSTQENQC